MWSRPFSTGTTSRGMDSIRSRAKSSVVALVATISTSTALSSLATAAGWAVKSPSRTLFTSSPWREIRSAVGSRATMTVSSPVRAKAPARKPPTPPGPRIALEDMGSRLNQMPRFRRAQQPALGPLGIDQHPGIEGPCRIERGFGGGQRGGERIRALAVVPGPVVAADGVVMGDGPAAVDHDVRGGPLYLRPLLELPADASRGEDREVRRRSIRIYVREAACDHPVATDIIDRRFGPLHDRSMERLEAVPGDRALERFGQHSSGHHHVAQIRGPEECLAPAADGIPAARGAAAGVPIARASALGTAAMLRAALKRGGHPRLDVALRRFEPQHEQSVSAVTGAGDRHLDGVQQPAVRRVQSGL